MRPMPFLVSVSFATDSWERQGASEQARPLFPHQREFPLLFPSCFLYITSAIISRFLNPWLPPTAASILPYKA